MIAKKETKEPVKKTAEKKVAETKTETEPKFKNVKKESKGTVKVEKKRKAFRCKNMPRGYSFNCFNCYCIIYCTWN